MNGELQQACFIVVASKKALKSKGDICFIPDKYVIDIGFTFLPQKNLCGSVTFQAKSVEEWYGECYSRGIEDIKLLTSYNAQDKNIVGYSNASPTSLLCFYKNHVVTYFTPNWSSDDNQKGWHIQYTECAWENPPSDKPIFSDPTDILSQTLEDIEQLAETLNYPYFTDCFRAAREFLSNGVPDIDTSLSELPIKNRKLFLAAQRAFVFGGMGSWNDSPPFTAHDKGLSEQYERLSSNLYQQLKIAILFAVNEW